MDFTLKSGMLRNLCFLEFLQALLITSNLGLQSVDFACDCCVQHICFKEHTRDRKGDREISGPECGSEQLTGDGKKRSSADKAGHRDRHEETAA